MARRKAGVSVEDNFTQLVDAKMSSWRGFRRMEDVIWEEGEIRWIGGPSVGLSTVDCGPGRVEHASEGGSGWQLF